MTQNICAHVLFCSLAMHAVCFSNSYIGHSTIHGPWRLIHHLDVNDSTLPPNINIYQSLLILFTNDKTMNYLQGGYTYIVSKRYHKTMPTNRHELLLLTL